MKWVLSVFRVFSAVGRTDAVAKRKNKKLERPLKTDTITIEMLRNLKFYQY